MTAVSPLDIVPFAKVAEVPAPMPSADRGRQRADRTVVKKRGVLAPLLFPIGVASGLVIVGVPSVAIWNIYSASETRRALHEAPLIRDDSVAKTSIKREVASDESEFVLRLIDGKLVRVIAPKSATDQFLNDTLLYLDNARAGVHRAASGELNQVFARAFATRESDLNAYADWFFEWGRSWRFLYEAVTGAVQEAARLSFSRTQITDAAREAVESYLIRHYQEFVLKPDLRDATIIAGVDETLRHAHDGYRAAVATLDDRMQRFLSEKTRYVEEIGGNVSVTIDWDAARWKAPRYSAEDRYLEPVGSAAVVAGGAVLGSVLERLVLPFFARTTAQIMISSELTVGGATVGSIEPGLGTALGALAGAALDWGISKFRESLERDDFVADNSAALDATIASWQGRISPEIDRAIDVWFDDTRAIIAKQAADK